MIVNKRGSLYVEASMVMPMVFMIITGLIGIVMWFNGCLFEQVNNHLNMWNELNKGTEAKYMRNLDGIKEIFDQ